MCLVHLSLLCRTFFNIQLKRSIRNVALGRRSPYGVVRRSDRIVSRTFDAISSLLVGTKKSSLVASLLAKNVLRHSNVRIIALFNRFESFKSPILRKRRLSLFRKSFYGRDWQRWRLINFLIDLLLFVHVRHLFYSCISHGTNLVWKSVFVKFWSIIAGMAVTKEDAVHRTRCRSYIRKCHNFISESIIHSIGNHDSWYLFLFFCI